MEPPWKLHQLEGAMQPSRLDKKQRLPTWNLHETYINSPWNLRGYSIKEDAIQSSGVDTGNMFEFF